MALNNTYTRQVKASPTALNPTQRYVEKYDATGALIDNLANLGNQVLDVYAKADYAAAEQDYKEEYANWSLNQQNAVREANAIAEPRDRMAAYEKAMDKINKKYGQNIDVRFAEKFRSDTALDNQKALFDLQYKMTQDLQAENKKRSQKYRDSLAEQSAGADPAYSAALDARAKADLDSLLAQGAISRFDYAVALEDYNKKKTAANIDYFLDSAPENWSDEEIDTVLDSLTANTADENERKQLKEFAKSKIEVMKKQNEYLDTFNELSREYNLFNDSVNNNLPLSEINRKIPRGASKEYKKLIKSLNGYGAAAKISDEQKAVMAQDVYDSIAGITSNTTATPKDYAAVQNKIYNAIAVKAVSVAEGNKLLGSIMKPLNDSWAAQTEKLSIGNWFSADIGAKGVMEWFNDNNLTADIPSGASATEKARIKASNARNKVQAYQLYYANLQKIVDDPNNAYTSVADIAAEKNVATKKAILQQAQDMTTQQLAKDKFKFLANYAPEQQPNKVLDGGALVGNTNNINNARLGTPVADTRYIGTAYDPDTGKYALKTKDGKYEEVSYEVYLQYGGK